MQCSLISFIEVKELTTRQREVLLAIRRLGNRATMKDVSIEMRVALNRISGRFSELERKKCIAKAGKRGRFTIYEIMRWAGDV